MTGHHVFVLGAGFSKAVDEIMPVTNELGNSISGALSHTSALSEASLESLWKMNFESWMSLVGEYQPYLSESDNLQNLALFSRVREAIHKELTLRQNITLGKSMPVWLKKLIITFHLLRATVVTFNYDTIVEAGLQSLRLLGKADEPITVGEILNEQPPLPQIGARLVRTEWNDTFRLLKLHGSLDWWSMPDDLSGLSLARTESRASFGEPISQSETQLQRELPGREPFLIPPSFGKSRYYQIPLIREIWRQAFGGLQRATRVSLIGYSMPVPDVTVSGLLHGALNGRDVQVDVVNIQPEDLKGRVSKLTSVQPSIYDSQFCVEKFASELIDDLSRTLVKALSSFDRDRQSLPILALPTEPSAFWLSSPVDRVTRDESTGDVILHVSKLPTPLHQSTAATFDSEGNAVQWNGVRIRDVLNCVGPESRLLLQAQDGLSTVVLHQWILRETGVSNLWLGLQSI